ncbi:hypothetical protein [Faecalispora anaeroviscerum]|uniref:hypothetical protein n=1 Tax=Faecalispora anaeroviscerum TaxID=2991836 RepID=UPI0024BABE58|nr:hypothetical protein [Faecalispora anaeroviscerum]
MIKRKKIEILQRPKPGQQPAIYVPSHFTWKRYKREEDNSKKIEKIDQQKKVMILIRGFSLFKNIEKASRNEVVRRFLRTFLLLIWNEKNAGFTTCVFADNILNLLY